MRRVLIVCLAAAASVGLHAQRPPRVAAASDLSFALEPLARRFAESSGERVELVFGSSGNLTRQIVDGAPFELFMSADEEFVQKLFDAGLTRDRGALYAVGRIALFAPHGSRLSVDERLDGLRALLANERGLRFAIANPEHAPYGRAARSALQAAGLWDAVQPGLVLGENVSQAAQFATSGGAVGGILAYSLVLAPPLREAGRYALLPESQHSPLRQRMVLLRRAGGAAERFYRYLQGAEARAVLAQYGFRAPEVQP